MLITSLLQKISVGGGGPRPTDIFLWRVKKDSLWRQVLDELYHAALNLCLRISYEVDREREVMSLLICLDICLVLDNAKFCFPCLTRSFLPPHPPLLGAWQQVIVAQYFCPYILLVISYYTPCPAP